MDVTEQIVNVLHRIDGVYEVAAGDIAKAEYCLMPVVFCEHQLEAMVNRATGHQHAINIVEEAPVEVAPAPTEEAPVAAPTPNPLAQAVSSLKKAGQQG